jgi:hypothetical protein
MHSTANRTVSFLQFSSGLTVTGSARVYCFKFLAFYVLNVFIIVLLLPVTDRVKASEGRTLRSYMQVVCIYIYIYIYIYDSFCVLVVRSPGFDSRRYQIFWQVMGPERGPLSLVSTIEELLGRKSRGSGIENQEYGRRDPLCWPRHTSYPQKLALTSLTSGGRSVGIVRSRTEATEFFFGFFDQDGQMDETGTPFHRK